jgi:ACS family hexuronate transporter-like MFS transporter
VKTRWIVVFLLFLANVLNYFDRQMLAVLKPLLSGEMHWSEIQYGDIVFWFQASYALSYLAFGRFVDRFGAKLGFGVAFLIWSCAQIAHGLARSAFDFTLARMALGAGEGGVYPAGLSAVAEWFERRERAFATGLFNAGVNIGAIVTPLVVPVIVLTLGWRAAFVLTGSLSLLWLVAWILIYRAPQTSADTGPKIPWSVVLRKKETWAYAAAKFLIDPVWWMFLFWLPDFFAKRHGLDLKSFGPPLVAIYLVSDLGNVAGGYASSRLIKAGISPNAARKGTMLVCALLALPVAFAMYIDTLWPAVAVLALAAAAHQAFSVNLFTIPSDVFPRAAMGSVIGIGGMFGAAGGMVMAKYAGWVLDRLGTFTPMFVVAAFSYLLALLIIHLLSPKLEPVAFSS